MVAGRLNLADRRLLWYDAFFAFVCIPLSNEYPGGCTRFRSKFLVGHSYVIKRLREVVYVVRLLARKRRR